MSEKVLDASVLLALLLNEPLPAGTMELFAEGVVSSVNVAEVLAKLSELGAASFVKCEALLATLKRVEPFTLSQARTSGALRQLTAHAGLSLRDCACLALALELNADVYTCDRAWSRITLGVPIHVMW